MSKIIQSTGGFDATTRIPPTEMQWLNQLRSGETRGERVGSWRRQPAWEPLPLLEVEPEPLPRRPAPIASAAESSGAAKDGAQRAAVAALRRPVAYDARGRVRTAVGSGMKELRAQLEAVAIEVALAARAAQEVSLSLSHSAQYAQNATALH